MVTHSSLYLFVIQYNIQYSLFSFKQFVLCNTLQTTILGVAKTSLCISAVTVWLVVVSKHLNIYLLSSRPHYPSFSWY